MSKPKPPITGKYIDPLVDFAFKKIFGSEPNKDLLIAFLSASWRIQGAQAHCRFGLQQK